MSSSLLYCYKYPDSNQRRHRKLDGSNTTSLQCGTAPSSSSANISDITTTTSEIKYIYDLSINTTAITLESAMTNVNSRIFERIPTYGFGDMYVCCSASAAAEQSANENSTQGVFAFALSNINDTEEGSGWPCNETLQSDAIKCSPIVGRMFVHANTTSDSITSLLSAEHVVDTVEYIMENGFVMNTTMSQISADVLDAVEYIIMDDRRLNNKNLNVTYIGKRSIAHGLMHVVPDVMIDAKDVFLNQVKTSSAALGPMGIATVALASILFMGLAAICFFKRCCFRRETKQSDGLQLASQDNGLSLEQPDTPKTESSFVYMKDVNATFGSDEEKADDHCGSVRILNSLNIIDDLALEHVEISLDRTLVSPTLSEVATDMISVALLTYTYADLRQCAAKRTGAYIGEENILSDLPVTSTDIYGFVKDNFDTLKEEEDFKGEKGLGGIRQFQALLDVGIDNSGITNGEVIVFNDKVPTHICYGIALSKEEKRIVVSFRGTSNIYDWGDNVKVTGAKVENPLYQKTANQKRHFYLHQGFYDALFEDKEGEKTKFQVILDQVIQAKSENPSYNVYATGHSLGGALSTLFAFFASTPQYVGNSTPFPVTCVSVASPLVGDYNWRCAFMLQEKMGRLRHLRITNYGDLVPKIPFVGFSFPPFTFKHVGVHLQLYDDKPPRFSYSTEGNTSWIDTKENIIVPLTPSQMRNLHGCVTYCNQIEKAKEVIRVEHLDHFYANEEFVGKYRNV